MRNLLFYLDYRSRSGAQRVMVELANYFAEHGDKVTLACQFESPQEGYALSDKVREVVLPKPSSNKLKRQADRIKALCGLCEEVNPDLIISFLIVSNLIALKVGEKMGIPVLISVRNDPARDGNRLNQFLIKRNYPKAAGCVFQTEEARDFFGFKYPTRVIMNPLSEEVINDLELMKKREPDEEIRFISLGRLEPQKRHDVAIKAIAAIADRYPNIKLSIFGKGPLETELKSLANELNVSKQVELKGVTSEVVKELSMSDAFVMASDYEGMPNALMEAMAAGLPCIVTDCPCGGPRTLINDGENGLLFPVGDEKQLSEKLEFIINNREAAAQIGERAKQLKEDCSIDIIAPMWGEMFDVCRKTHS